jgi:CheY-like chemotaxis protein
MADDDPDDRFLMKQALAENKLFNKIEFIENGVELMDYLLQRAKYALNKPIKPGLILLDINIPKMDGREILRQMKSNKELRRIPVVVLTASQAEEDIFQTYDLGVNSFICKPTSFQDLVEVVREIGNYWFGIVVLSPK